jgi:hypothetical protein
MPPAATDAVGEFEQLARAQIPVGGDVGIEADEDGQAEEG